MQLLPRAAASRPEPDDLQSDSRPRSQGSRRTTIVATLTPKLPARAVYRRRWGRGKVRGRARPRAGRGRAGGSRPARLSSAIQISAPTLPLATVPRLGPSVPACGGLLFVQRHRPADPPASRAMCPAEPQASRATDQQSHRPTEPPASKATGQQNHRPAERPASKATGQQSLRPAEPQASRATDQQSHRPAEPQAHRPAEPLANRAPDQQAHRSGQQNRSPRPAEPTASRAPDQQGHRSGQHLPGQQSRSPMLSVLGTRNSWTEWGVE